MANIARGEAECYISIKVKCFIFLYSTRQGNALTVIENNLYKFAHHHETSHNLPVKWFIISVSQCYLLFIALSISIQEY